MVETQLTLIWTGIVGFANSYGFRAGGIGALGLEVLTTVLDADGLVVHQQTTLGDGVTATSAIVNQLLR